MRGALRILAVAPTGTAGLDVLKDARAARLDAGEVEWLDPVPVEGPTATLRQFFDRLLVGLGPNPGTPS